MSLTNESQRKLPEDLLSDPVSLPDEFLTPAEVAKKLKVAKATVYNMVTVGILPAIRLGRTVRIPCAQFEEFIASGGKSFDGVWRKEEAPRPIVRESSRK